MDSRQRLRSSHRRDVGMQDTPVFTEHRRKYFPSNDRMCCLVHHSQYFPLAVDDGGEGEAREYCAWFAADESRETT